METSPSSVDACKTSNYKKGKSTQWEEKAKSKEEQSQSKEACGYCGRSKHPRADCPAKEKECNKCGKVGHFGNVCRSKPSGGSGGHDIGRSKSRGHGDEQPNETGVRSVWISTQRGGRDGGHSKSRGRGDEQPNETGVRSGWISTQRGGCSRSRSTHMPEVRCGRVAARHVRDDAAPTPLM